MARTALGELIQEARKTSGLSQAKLARLIPGLTRSTLSAIEVGNTKSVSADIAERLASLLSLTVPQILEAMGYAAPTITSDRLDEEMLRSLEAAPDAVLDAVRLLLDGWRVQQRAQRALEASLRASYPAVGAELAKSP